MLRLTFGMLLAVLTQLPAYSAQSPTRSGHVLFAWAGDVAHKGNDFLAVIDADPKSASYGHLVTTVVTDQKSMQVSMRRSMTRTVDRVSTSTIETGHTDGRARRIRMGSYSHLDRIAAVVIEIRNKGA